MASPQPRRSADQLPLFPFIIYSLIITVAVIGFASEFHDAIGNRPWRPPYCLIVFNNHTEEYTLCEWFARDLNPWAQ